MSKRNADGGQHTDETLFWQWATEQGAEWVRYSPDLARALASPPAALILSAAIHKSCIRSATIHSAGRWFYMSDKDWMRELALRECDVTRSLSLLCVDWKRREIRYQSEAAGRGKADAGKVRRARMRFGGLGLMQRWITNRTASSASAVSHYRVNFVRLKEWWSLNGVGQLTLPVSSNGGNQFPQVEETSYLNLGIPVCWPRGNQLPPQQETSVDDVQGMTPNSARPDGDGDGARGERAGKLRWLLQAEMNITDAGVLDELSEGFAAWSPDLEAATACIREIAGRDIDEALRHETTKRGTPIRSLTGLTIAHLRDELVQAGIRK